MKLLTHIRKTSRSEWALSEIQDPTKRMTSEHDRGDIDVAAVARRFFHEKCGTGASKAASSSSEELAAQAEELLDSISFFRIAQSGAAPGRSPNHHPKVSIGRESVASGTPTTRSPARSASARKARVKGFAIDMMMAGADADVFRERA
jgi:methyl-accepting chemotaxis protein